MPLAPLPFEALAEIAMAVVQSPDSASAVELLATQLSHLFSANVAVFEKCGRQWRAVAGEGRAFDDHDWQAGLMPELSGAPALLPLRNARGEYATLLPLTGPGGPALALVLDGDWTADHSTLKVFALLVAIGLDSLRQRDERRAAERRVVAAYAMARRLSRLRSVDQVSQHVVDHIATLLDADRVSLSLYDKDEHALYVAAAHGYPLSDVSDVRVPHGGWVVGHVYARRRPLFVGDARLFPGMQHQRYSTQSFAAVPLLAGPETVGVLSITEKRHDRFGPEDEMLLRGISVIAGLALVAARSTTEAATLAHAATIDSVTGLLNRPYLDNRLAEEVARSKRESTRLAVLIGDIDNFKQINDAFGHQTGDQVLRIVGGIIRSAVRVFDVCARYGGDEFAILMPNCDRDSAVACAERIRLRVSEYAGSGVPALSMSIGVAVIESDENAASLMSRADRYLYQAKADGKNVVRAASDLVRRESPVYTLIVDADDGRATMCAAVARRFGIKTTITRSSHEALGVIGQSGPPAVLIIDLSVPPAGGFVVIEALREDRRSDIVAWSAAREITEYASRYAGPNTRVLSGAASPSTIRMAVEKAIARHVEGGVAEKPSGPSPEEADRIMKTLAEKAQQLGPTAGVAVCLKTPGAAGFRTFVNWTSDEAMPHLPYAVPQAVDRVIETGRAIPETPGLAAVPIMIGDKAAGAICIFDVKPLALDDRNVAMLAAMGRDAFANGPALALEAARPVPFRDRASDRRQSDAGRPMPSPQIEWPPAILERKGGEFAVARELARARREGRQLSVVLFDVGQATGDTPANIVGQHLEAVSDTLVRAIRQSDLPIRWDETELLVVLPGLPGDEARTVAQRVRAALQAGAGHRLSVSGGVAELEGDERFSDVVERARQKVAMAIGRGHNRVL